MAPPAITLRPRSRTTSAGATYVFSPTALNEFRVSFFRPRNDLFVPSENQNWGATLGIPNISPALMPSFSPTALGVGTYTVAPDYAQLYGLTVQGATRQIRQSESLRDDFSKIHGSHAFKMGYEILHFTDNFYQQGYPSGQFNFANTTAGLQPNGQPIPNTGNTFAGFELGSVSAVNFSTYTNTWQPRSSINSLYFQDDWKFSKNLTFNLGLRWSTESPYHTAHGQESQFSPTTVDPLTGMMGAVIHPTGGLNNRDLKNFQPRIGMAYHPLREVGVPRRLRTQYRSISDGRIKAMQFDEYQAQVVQQRLSNNPLPLFQLSQGPAPVAYNILPNGTAAYVGTNYGSRNVTWLDPTLHPGYVAELERHRRVPDQREQSVQGVLCGIGRRASGGKLEHQRLPDEFRRRQSDAARCGLRQHPGLSAVSAVRHASITWPTPVTPATTPARSSIRSVTPRAWCWIRSTPTRKRSTTATPITAPAPAWHPSRIAT